MTDMMISLHLGDCLDIIQELAPCSIDTLITDPPAGIKFMGKRWDNLTDYKPRTERARQVWLVLESLVSLGVLQRWEAGFLLFTVDWSSAVLRVLKPGAMGLVWALPRVTDLVAMGLRMSGYIIRDRIAHIFGTGFPKSHDVSKAIDKAAGAKREVVRKHPQPCSNINATAALGGAFQVAPDITAPATPAAQLWDGWGTALKPAVEDWWLVMKPLDGTFAHNALAHGVAGLWVDGGRIPTDEDTTCNHYASIGYGGSKVPFTSGSNKGRFPANLILDEQASALLDAQSGESCHKRTEQRKGGIWNSNGNGGNIDAPGDIGGASRFFYTAKASRAERTASGLIENDHPTVKSLSLMRYLCRLTRTPTGGVILDPFMGSGTTGIAAILEDRPFIGIEEDPAYFAIAQARIKHAQDEQARLSQAPHQPGLL